MSYLVLARKYRPRNFGEMVGQPHVVRALTHALTSQRLHHAYLFTGTRGVGKTTVSRILAKSLNCTGADGTGGITAEPCGQCAACREIDSGRFPDYIELDAASNRGVDEVQALLEQAAYKPVQGRFKVFMIDEVHMLTTTAFNAMLKTLEEPPGYLKFVLATTDPQKVPVTVLSRCLQFNLRPMAAQTVFEHLRHVLHAEGITAEPQALRLLAAAARGSMRDALSLTDQAIAFSAAVGATLAEDAVRQMLGSTHSRTVFDMVQAVATGDGARVVALVDGLRRDGASPAVTLEALTDTLHRMAVQQVLPGTGASSDTDADMDAGMDADADAADIRRLAQMLSPEMTQLFYSISLHGRQELGLAPDEYAALTMTLLRLLPFLPSKGGALGTSSSGTGGAVPTPASAPLAADTSMAAVAAVPATDAASLRAPLEVPAPPEGPAAFGASSISRSRMATSSVTEQTPLPVSALQTQSEQGAVISLQADSNVQAHRDEPSPSAHMLMINGPDALPDSPSLTSSPGADAQGAVQSDAAGAAREVTGAVVPELSPPWDDTVQSPVTESPPCTQAASDEEAPAPDRPDTQPLASEELLQGTVYVDPALGVVSPDERLGLGDFWHATVSELGHTGHIAALTKQLASQAELVDRVADRWVLRVQNTTLGSPATVQRLRDVLAAHTGRAALELDIVHGPVSDTPAQREQRIAQAIQDRAHSLARTHPGVQVLLEHFPGAAIVPGSVRSAALTDALPASFS